MKDRKSAQLICVLFLLLALLAPSSTCAAALRATNVVPRPNYEYIALVPARPADADRIHVAAGVLESYTLVKRPMPAEMLLTIRDAATNTSRTFDLAFATTLNGRPLVCKTYWNLGNNRFCAALPDKLVPGKTKIAILYWNHAFDDFPRLAGADAIVTVTP